MFNKTHFWLKFESKEQGEILSIYAKPPLADKDVCEQLKTEPKL